MKTIDIKTTQNVTLEYELADLRDRVFAYLIDLAALVVSITILSSLEAVAFINSPGAMMVFTTLVLCIFLFYSLVMEVLNNGQSIGKMAMKIRVVKTAGGQATFTDYASRWVFRIIDIYFSFGSVAAILVASSQRAQRIGDVVAGTAVVKLIPTLDLSLDELLSIQSRETYQPTYPEAKELEESQVVLIKAALNRYARLKNDAHEKALAELAQKVSEFTGAQRGNDPVAFLRSIVKDYVVMTR